MANIAVNYDTNSKILSITQDGTKLEDVKEIRFSCMGEDKEGNDCHRMIVERYSNDEDNSIFHTYTMYAKKYEDEKTVEAVRELLSNLNATSARDK